MLRAEIVETVNNKCGCAKQTITCVQGKQADIQIPLEQKMKSKMPRQDKKTSPEKQLCIC